MRCLFTLIALSLSNPLTPREILSGEWDVFNGTSGDYVATPVGYFETHNKLSNPNLLVTTIWSTARRTALSEETHPLVEQVTITFTSDRAGQFTTLHDLTPIPFSLPEKGVVSFTTVLGSFTVTAVSDSEIEIRSESSSFVGTRPLAVAIPREVADIRSKFGPRAAFWRQLIAEFGRYKWLLIPSAALSVAMILALIFCRPEPAPAAPPKEKTE
jgi:hypothetical protein